MEKFLIALPGTISQGLVWGIMAIGLYITYKILSLSDLTVDGSIGTGAAVCTMLITAGVNPWIAVLCAFLAGAICGLVTGFFHTVLEIPAILSGILTQLMLWTINLKIMGQANRPLFENKLLSLLEPTKAIFMLLIFALGIVAVLYWFFGTELGCSIRATGCNEMMSRAQGINTNLTKVLGLVLSNAIIALAGALLAQYQGYADVTMGVGAIVKGLAAIIIGEAVFGKIARNFAVRLCGVLVGGIIYYFVYQIIVFMGLDTDLLKMISAVVVAFFLGVPNLRKKIFKQHKHKGGEVRDNA